jgi:PAS domain S-box-containing protein
LINGMGESAWVIDFVGNFVEVNDAAVEMLGYSREELLSLGIKGIDKYLNPEQVKNLMSRVVSGKNQVFETVHTTKDGTEIPVEISSSLITYQEKQVILAIARNITERKKAEETMRKSEERYRELANFLPVIVFETDLTGKITFFSRRAFELTGVTPEDVEKGSNIISFVLPQEREKAIENMKKSMAGEDHSANEYTLVRKNGTTYPALVRTTPIISENRVIGVRGLVIDITERKKAEMDLKESRDKLELMNESCV